MAVRSLKICILILALMLPGTAFAIIGTSSNYKIDVGKTTGTGFKAESPNYSAVAVIDENFNTKSTEYLLCGSFTSAIWGCRPVAPPPPPPPPPPDGPEAGGITEIPEEPVIEPEIPDEPEEPEEEIPEHIIFTWDDFEPAEEPEIPAQEPEPEQIAFVPPAEIVEEEVTPPRGAALEPAQGAWCEQIACYGAAKVLLRPAAPQITYIQICPIIQYVLALLLIILAALLPLLSHRIRDKRRLFQ